MSTLKFRLKLKRIAFEDANRLILSNSGYLGLTTFITKGSALALFIAVSRLLSQEDVGRFILATTLLVIIYPVVDFGARAFVPREVAINRHFVKDNFISILVLQEAIALVAASALAVIVLLGIFEPLNSRAIPLFLPVLLCFAPIHLVDAVLLGIEDMKTSTLIQSLLYGGNLLLCVVALILSNGNFTALAGAYVLSYLVAAAVSLGVVCYRFRLDSASVKRIRRMGKSLSPFVVVSFLDTLKNRIDVLILARMVTNDQLAIYGAGYRLFDGIRVFVSYPYSTAVYPRMAALFSAGRRKRPVYRRFAVIAGIMGFGAGLMLFVVADSVVALVYPPTYASAAVITRILAISVLFDAVNAVTGRTLFILHKPGEVSFGVLIAVVTNVLANMLLIPSLGIIGAAWATNITYLVYCAYLLYRLAANLRDTSIPGDLSKDL